MLTLFTQREVIWDLRECTKNTTHNIALSELITKFGLFYRFVISRRCCASFLVTDFLILSNLSSPTSNEFGQNWNDHLKGLQNSATADPKFNRQTVTVRKTVTPVIWWRLQIGSMNHTCCCKEWNLGWYFEYERCVTLPSRLYIFKYLFMWDNRNDSEYRTTATVVHQKKK